MEIVAKISLRTKMYFRAARPQQLCMGSFNRWRPSRNPEFETMAQNSQRHHSIHLEWRSIDLFYPASTLHTSEARPPSSFQWTLWLKMLRFMGCPSKIERWEDPRVTNLQQRRTKGIIWNLNYGKSFWFWPFTTSSKTRPISGGLDFCSWT